jgi:hypothetical protein
MGMHLLNGGESATEINKCQQFGVGDRTNFDETLGDY